MIDQWVDIAIIGIQLRVPDANNPWEFADNLLQEKISISTFQAPHSVKKSWVGARGLIHNAELFDPTFFGITDSEAAMMDPQHRLLMEMSVEALEISGVETQNEKSIGSVFVSASQNNAHFKALNAQNISNSELLNYQHLLTNDRDFIATRIAYYLNMRGPAMTIQSGCSSSLVAVHQACRSLQLNECNFALAAGISVTFPLEEGYDAIDGMIYSPKGQCLPFSQYADGTVGGTGGAVIVLKRLDDAIADGNEVWGIIRGSAINNDGARKVGFTAPGVDSQIAVMQKALSVADLKSQAVDYIEGHGTGTQLGDAIEIAALNEVYAGHRTHPCYLGSVKANIGHLDAASGIIGLAKIILSLRLNRIFPQPYNQYPNRQLDPKKITLAGLKKAETHLAHAAITSLGIGGTNVHMIVSNVSRSGWKMPLQFTKKIPTVVFSRRKFPSPASASLDFISVIKQQQKNMSTNIKNDLENIWNEVLGTTGKILPNEHFFERGGHSLLAVQMISTLNDYFKINLSSVALFDHPTFSRLYDHVYQNVVPEVKSPAILKEVESNMEENFDEL